MERTFVLIKPDAVERNLIGEIISMYEKKGLKITALQMLKPTREIAELHYGEHRGKPYYEELITFITRSPICALIIDGINSVAVVRKINGATDPMEADMGSIRGKFGLSKTENTVHSSSNIESALREIEIWFTEEITQ